MAVWGTRIPIASRVGAAVSRYAQAWSQRLHEIAQIRPGDGVILVGDGSGWTAGRLPSVLYGHVTASATTIASSYTAITWDTRSGDTTPDMAWTSTSQVTIYVAGIYELDATIGAGVVSTNTLYARWRKGGATTLGAGEFKESEESSRNVQVRAFVPYVSLAAGDVITLEQMGDNATNTENAGACSIRRLS